ncbi:MAG: integration host factor subunit beta [Neisseriaceae bacterium]|nr:MAG: integration host factor subunit beta [Neisseriaceae bacterium]
MNKSDIIEKLQTLTPKLRKTEAKKLVDSLFQYMVEQLATGNRIEVRGFGSFSIKVRKAGKIRNPRHGTSIDTDERRVVYFRAGNEMAKRVDYKNN